MGRWAQARRTGGSQGGTGEQGLARMAQGDKESATIIRVSYTGNVDAGELNDPEAFHATPSATPSDNATQVAPNVIDLTMAGDISTDTGLDFDDVAAGVLTPDSILLN